jgi:hypothetical protein
MFHLFLSLAFQSGRTQRVCRTDVRSNCDRCNRNRPSAYLMMTVIMMTISTVRTLPGLRKARLRKFFCKAHNKIFEMRKILLFVRKHKVVRCTDKYREARAQAASSATLSLVSLSLSCGFSLHLLVLFHCYLCISSCVLHSDRDCKATK